MRTIADWRRARADRRAVRAELSAGDGWLEYRRRRRAAERELRAERRAQRRTGHFGESDRSWGQTYGSGGFFSKNQPPRR